MHALGKTFHAIFGSFFSVTFSFSILIFCSLIAFSTLAKPLDDNNPPPLRIAVSANFASTLNSLLADFQQQTGIRCELITGATGTLFQQIVHGAPYDILLAADAIRPQKLVELKLADEHSRQTYAIGKLAFWSANWQSNMPIPSYQQLLDRLAKQPEKIAIANPTLAPYGKATKQMLETHQLWQTMQHHLITGNNIGQTFQQIRSQAVTFGLVAYSQLIQNKLTGVVVPQQDHQPIEQQAVVISRSKQAALAKQLLDYLLSEQVQHKLVQLGYRSIKQQAVINL